MSPPNQDEVRASPWRTARNWAPLAALTLLELAYALAWSLPVPAPETPVEPRYAAVIGFGSSFVAAGFALHLRPRVLQRMATAVAVFCLATVVFPGSVLLATGAALVLLAGVPALIALGIQAQWGRGVRVRIFACLLGVVLGYSWVTQALAIGFVGLGLVPGRIAYSSKRPGTHPETDVELQTADGLTLRGTYSPGAGHRAALLVHGVSSGRGRMQPLADRLVDAGFHVLRYDQRGHGRSAGLVCTYGPREEEDILTAWRWLASQPGVTPSDGVLVGTSMGGAGVLRAAGPASKLGVSRVVALAPASDFVPLVRQRLGWLGPLGQWLRAGSELRVRSLGVVPPWLEASPAERFAKGTSGMPLLVLHGDPDDTVPYELSVALERRLHRPVLRRLPGVAHRALPEDVADDPTHWELLRAFLEER